MGAEDVTGTTFSLLGTAAVHSTVRCVCNL